VANRRGLSDLVLSSHQDGPISVETTGTSLSLAPEHDTQILKME
jgi:hypothetical protein